jgi:hypothetical protein
MQEIYHHEFYQLVLSYKQAEAEMRTTMTQHRVCAHLFSASIRIVLTLWLQIESGEVDRLFNTVWSVEKVTEAAQRPCGSHGTVLALSVAYEKANYHADAAAAVRASLARARELATEVRHRGGGDSLSRGLLTLTAARQKFALFAFNAKFAWMQVDEYLTELLCCSTFARLAPDAEICRARTVPAQSLRPSHRRQWTRLRGVWTPMWRSCTHACRCCLRLRARNGRTPTAWNASTAVSATGSYDLCARSAAPVC